MCKSIKTVYTYFLNYCIYKLKKRYVIVTRMFTQIIILCTSNLRKPALFCSDKRAADVKLQLLSRKSEIIPDITTNIFLSVK